MLKWHSEFYDKKPDIYYWYSKTYHNDQRSTKSSSCLEAAVRAEGTAVPWKSRVFLFVCLEPQCWSTWFFLTLLVSSINNPSHPSSLQFHMPISCLCIWYSHHLKHLWLQIYDWPTSSLIVGLFSKSREVLPNHL